MLRPPVELTVGPCHWTLGIVYKTSTGYQVESGELCGTLAYLEYAHPTAADTLLHDYGVTIQDDWVDGNGTPNGARLFSRNLRKYTSWLAMQNDSGEFENVPLVEQEGDYFKSWHWIYRWVSSLRTSQGLRAAIWDMSRVRLRDLQAIPIDVHGKTYRIGDVFTSERSMAILMRWHVRYPGYVAAKSAGRDVTGALRLATQKSVPGGWKKAPETWTDDHERALLDGLLSRSQGRSQGFQNTIEQVNGWPKWKSGSNHYGFKLSDGLAALKTQRNSFNLDMSGLPAAP